MIQEENIYVGAPKSIREYMYISDHVNAYIQAMERGKKGEVYNIASGQGIRNIDLAEKIAEKVGYEKNKIIFGSYPPGYPLRPIVSDQPFIMLDPAKAKRELGWECKVSLDNGLEKMINYWKTK